MANINKSTMREVLTEVGQDLVVAIRGELERQGHVNTGRLRDSIGYKISEFGGNMTLTVLANEVDYASAINDGFRPNSLPNVYAIEEWVKQRGIQSNNPKLKTNKALAFAIAKTIQREGSPTRGSFQFSKNGFRRGFANRPFGSRRNSIHSKIVKGMTVELEISLDSITKEI